MTPAELPMAVILSFMAKPLWWCYNICYHSDP